MSWAVLTRVVQALTQNWVPTDSLWSVGLVYAGGGVGVGWPQDRVDVALTSH